MQRPASHGASSVDSCGALITESCSRMINPPITTLLSGRRWVVSHNRAWSFRNLSRLCFENDDALLCNGISGVVKTVNSIESR